MLRFARTAPPVVLAASLVALGALGATTHERHPRPAATRAASPPAVPPVPPGLRLTRFEVRSQALHQVLPEVLLEPRAPDPRRGLVVFLHADHGDEQSTLSTALYSALVRLGRDAPAMVFIGGGRRSYWHDRSGAAWGRYVLEEVLPAALRRTGGDPRRVMIAGISMGAYGALDLARLHPRRFCAVDAHSPRLWRRWRAARLAQPDGFDDRRDFERHNLLRIAARRPRTFAAQPIWLDAGREDSLARPLVLTLARTLRRHGVRVHVHTGWRGGHGGAYWARHWGAYLRFEVAALHGCAATAS